MSRVVLLMVLMCFLFTALAGAVIFDPWQQLETPHFMIYYVEGIEEKALQVGAIAEDIHSQLTDYLEYEPSRRTGLIIFSNQDIPMGWAQVMWGSNTMALSLAHPSLTMGLGESTYESWIRLVLTHEYAHILQLNLPPEDLWPWGWVSYIFPTSLTQPYWFIEGFAVAMETEFTEGGRGDSPAIEAQLHAQADGDNLYSFDQVQGLYPLESWPGASATYNYGVYFLQYLEELYGPGFSRELARSYTENPFLGLGGWFRRLTGHDLQRQYVEWQETLGTGERTPQGRPLTYHWGYNINASLSPDARRVAYFHGGEETPALRIWSQEGEYQVQQAQGLYGGSPAWSPDARYLAYSRLEPARHKDLLHHIYIHDLRNDEERLITGDHGGRYPAWSSQGEIAYVEPIQGDTQVVGVSPAGDGYRVIVPPDPRVNIRKLSWDPQARYLAMETWLEGGKSGICIWDETEEDLHTLFIEDMYISGPEWSGDGRYLLFIGLGENNHDLYAFDTEEDTFYQITQSPYGVYGVSSVGEKIVHTALTDRGYQLFTMDLLPQNWQEVDLQTYDPVPAEDWPDYDPDTFTVGDYPLLRKLVPKMALPLMGVGKENNLAVGLTIMGWDPLDLVHYEWSILSDFASLPAYSLYTALYPDMGAFDSLEILLEGGYLGKDRIDGGRIMGRYPLDRGLFHEHALYIGGGLSWADAVYPQLDLGYGSVMLQGWNDLALGSTYSLGASGGIVPNSIAGNIWGGTQQTLGLSRGTQVGGSLDFQGRFGQAPRVLPRIRGYDTGDFIGDLALTGTLSGWQRLWNIERGLGPVFLENFRAGLFMDGVLTYDGQVKTGAALGMEVALEVNLLYGRLPFNLIGGIAQNDQDRRTYYVRLSQEDLGNPLLGIKDWNLFSPDFWSRTD